MEALGLELGVREGVWLLGGLLVLGLLLDGLRRHRRERANAIRMRRGLRPLDPVPGLDDPPDRELIGRIRVVERERAAAAEAAARADDETGSAPETPSRRSDTGNEANEIPVLVNRVALATAHAARQQDRSGNLEPTEQQSLFDEAGEPVAGADELLVLNVMAPDDEGLNGNAVMQILLACDCRFGGMDIFHRHEKSGGRGPVQFSVANLVEPGSFDLDALPEQRLPGLCFFLSLPGPENPLRAYNYMVETAQCLVRNLDADLVDEAFSAVTTQTLEHGRQRIRDYERRRLAQEV